MAELPYYALMVGLQHFGEPLPFPTHLERLLRHYLQGLGISGVESGFRPENLATYPYLYARLAGPVLAVAIAAGAVDAVRTGDRGARAALLWLLLPIVPPSFTAAGARYAAITLPAAALLAGRVLDPGRWPGLRERLGPRGAALAVAALLVTCLPWALAPVGWTSGHGAAHARIVPEADGSPPCVVSIQPYVSAVHLGADAVRPAPRSREELDAAVEAGCRVVVVDAIATILRRGDPFTDGFLGELERLHPDPVTVPNPAAASILFPFEYNFAFGRTTDYLVSEERTRAGRIALYPLVPSGPAGPGENGPRAEPE